MNLIDLFLGPGAGQISPKALRLELRGGIRDSTQSSTMEEEPTFAGSLGYDNGIYGSLCGLRGEPSHATRLSPYDPRFDSDSENEPNGMPRVRSFLDRDASQAFVAATMRSMQDVREPLQEPRDSAFHGDAREDEQLLLQEGLAGDQGESRGDPAAGFPGLYLDGR